MSSLPPDLGQELRPSAEQVEDLIQPLPRAWVERLAAGSRPSAAELAHFQRRLQQAPAPARALTWQRPALALAMVCVLLLLGWLGLRGDPELPSRETVALAVAGTLELGPTIRAEGDAQLVVVREDALHQRVTMGPGRATFEVDPHGPGSGLVVLAGEVEVEVKGTAFTVDMAGDRVAVLVHRGLVEVRHDGIARLLEAGDTWSTPEPRTAGAVIGRVQPVAPEPVNPKERTPASGVPMRVQPPLPASVEPPVPELAQEQHHAPVPAEEPAGSGKADDAAAAAAAYASILDLAELGASAELRRQATERYLGEHGGSAFTEQVGAMNLEARCELSPSRELVAELDVWLEAHPQSPWRQRMLAARARAAHEGLGDCALARPSYAELVDQGGAAWRSWAQEGLARCWDER